MTRHLITGATGLLGTAIALEIAERFPRDELYFIVRPDEGDDTDADVRTRLLSTLYDACDAYDSDDAIRITEAGERPLASRTTVMAADLTDGALRKRLTFRHQIDMVWHCAGRPPAGAAPGTGGWDDDTTAALHVLNLSQQLRVGRLIMVSSAFVQPHARGRAKEQRLAVPNDPSVPDHPYAQAKARVEQAVAGFTVPTVVLRPGLLLGHSRTGWWGGTRVPPYAAAVADAQNKLGDLDPDGAMLVGMPAHTLVNGLTVDHAATQAVTIALTRTPSPVYHLVPDVPLSMTVLADRLSYAARLPMLRLDADAPIESAMQAAAYRTLAAFRPVPGAAEMFDRTEARGATGMRDQVRPETLERVLSRAARSGGGVAAKPAYRAAEFKTRAR